MPQAVAIPLAFAISAASIGSSIHQGQQQKKAQRRALRSQEEAQRQAHSRAVSDQRRSEIEQRRLKRRTPDIGSLLGEERDRSRTGSASTLLTGTSGVGRERLRLGRSSLLGE